MSGWFSDDVNNGPGVVSSGSNVTGSSGSSGSLGSGEQIIAEGLANAKEVSDEYYERQLENEAVNREWSAGENQKNREWQEYMSNTAHQREVADLIAAGLNPVLSAKYGSGASTGSVSSQSTPSSSAASNAGNIFTQLFSSAIGLAAKVLENEQSERNSIRQASTSVQTTKMNNETDVITTGMNNDTSITIADAKNMTEAEIAALDRESRERLAQQQIDADMKICERNAQVNMYISDNQRYANKYNTDMQKLINDSNHEFQAYMAHNYPSSLPQLASAMGYKIQRIIEFLADKYSNSIYSETGVSSEVEAFQAFQGIIQKEFANMVNDFKKGQIPAILTGLVI